MRRFFVLLLVLTAGLFFSQCFSSERALASDATTPATHCEGVGTVTVPKAVDTQSAVVLSQPHTLQTFTPSSEVHYNETVVIKAPTPEQEAPQAIPVKRFKWLNIESKPLNPTQQTR